MYIHPASLISCIPESYARGVRVSKSRASRTSIFQVL